MVKIIIRYQSSLPKIPLNITHKKFHTKDAILPIIPHSTINQMKLQKPSGSAQFQDKSPDAIAHTMYPTYIKQPKNPFITICQLYKTNSKYKQLKQFPKQTRQVLPQKGSAALQQEAYSHHKNVNTTDRTKP